MIKVMSLAALLMAALALVTPAYCQDTPLLSLESQENKVVKVPTGLLKQEDDGVCTLRWNGYPNQTDAAALKFEVRWGSVTEGFVNTANAFFNIYQAQPLVNGVPYQAQVRAVDRWGRASAWAPTIYFTGNSVRVDAIRAQCSVPGGFFDDFNLPAGKPDWLKWNFAVNRYTDENINHFFINSQLHAHVEMGTLRNDRSLVVSRPRNALLDLSDNGTRTIFIDMDLNPDLRNDWYLDLIPEGSNGGLDISPRQTVDLIDKASVDPGYMLRLTQQGARLSCQMADSKGAMYTKAAGSVDTLKNVYAKTIVNVRRSFKFTISKTLVECFALGFDGVYYKVFSGAISVPWDRARPFNTVFGYNTLKNGYTAWIWHFDNFGFDAPANSTANPVIYDYKTQLTNGQEYGGANASYVIKVPDAVTSWGQKLFCTIMKSSANGSQFKKTVYSSVTVNGRTFPVIVPDDVCRSIAIDLPAGLIVRGDNQINFALASTGVLNVHIEATRPASASGALPAYSTHCQIWGCAPPATFELGSDAMVTGIGTYQTWLWDFKTPIVVSGKISVDTKITQGTCLTGTGIVAEVDRMEFQIDKGAVLSTSLSQDTPGLGGKYRYTLDTTQLSNGVHELFLQTYTPAGNPANPAYFERNSTNHGPKSYIPILIDVQN